MRPEHESLANARLDDLLKVLLRQFKRPLAARDIHLPDTDTEMLAQNISTRAPEMPLQAAMRAAIADAVAESEAVLARWHLTFEQALRTEMDAIPGWETTAEFLAIAEEKTNAELRIAVGAALLAALGDLRHANKLLSLYEHDPLDTDALIGKRLLSFALEIDADAANWPQRARASLAAQQPPNA